MFKIFKVFKMFKKILWSQLLNLDAKQSKLFHTYCGLISNNSILPQEKLAAKSYIWEQALDDIHLSSCLELIDYFVDFGDSNSATDKRIYLSEYLLEELQKVMIASNREELLLKEEGYYNSEKISLANVSGTVPKIKFLEDGGYDEKQVLTMVEINEFCIQEDEPLEEISLGMILDMAKAASKFNDKVKEKASALITEALINCF